MLGELLACADDFVGRPHVVDLRPLGFLGFKQTRGAVESDATVIADDAPTAVCVGKAGDDAGPSAAHDFGRVGVEDAVIVRLAIFREGFVDLRVRLEAGGLQSRLDHPQPAIRENGALERLIGLQPDDHLVVAIDIPGLVRQQRRWRLRVHRENTLLLLILEIGLEFRPNRLRPVRRPGEETFVAVIRGYVAHNEIADVDLGQPHSGREVAPAAFVPTRLAKYGRSFHGIPPRMCLLRARPSSQLAISSCTFARVGCFDRTEIVCRAIISSSSVGIDIDRDLAARRGYQRPSRGIGVIVEFDAKPSELLGDARADHGRILADAGGENKGIESAQRRRQHPGAEPDAMNEIVDGKLRARVLVRLQLAHVIADAGQALQAALAVEQILHRRGRSCLFA